MRALATTVISRLRIGHTWLTDSPFVGQHYRQHWRNIGCLAAGILLFAAPLLFMGLFRAVNTDHDLHVRLIQRGIETGIWPVHFLFPTVVYALSGFSSDFTTLAWAALFFLTICVLAKGCLTYFVLARKCAPPTNVPLERAPRYSRETLMLLVTAALLVAAPIVRPWQTNRVYLGQISPNVWHNPTSLVCWPFAIALFFAANDFLRSKQLRTLAVVAALAILSVLAKPNYFLAFAPVFGLVSLLRFGPSRLWALSQLAMLPTVVILYWQLTASFDGADAMRPGRRIAWMPLAAWHVYSKSIPVSLLFSLAFPLSYLIVFWRSLKNSDLLTFAWAVMLSALAWTACFAEVVTADGAVDVEFNFSWGAHLAAYVLFLVTAIDMCDNSAALQAIGPHRLGGWQAQLPWWLFGTHAASGAYWIARQALGRGYG